MKKSRTLKKRVHLSADQISTLCSAPILVIPSPGPGRYVYVSRVTGYFKFNGTQFTGTHNIRIGVNDTFKYYNQDIAGAANHVVIDGAAPGFFDGLPAVGLADQPIKVWMISGDPADGNGEIFLELSYEILPIPA